MRHKTLSFLAGIFFASILMAQTPFQKTFGGSNSDEVGNMIKTNEGYAIVGGSISSATNTWDVILVSFDEDGDTLQSKLFSNIEIERTANDPLDQIGVDLVQTNDGDYIIVATVEGEVEGNQTREIDILAFRYDPNNDNIEWESVYARGNFADEVPTGAALSQDGSRLYISGYGYNLAQNANRGDKTDGFVMGVDANNGQQQWTTSFANVDNDFNEVAYDVAPAPDGGVYVCGVSSRNHTPYGFTLSDLNMATSFGAKLGYFGNQQWIKEFEVPNNRNYQYIALQAIGITARAGGGFAITGGISYNQQSDESSLEAVIIESEDNGFINFVRAFNGGDRNVYGTSIVQTDDGYAISGAIVETGDEVRDIYIAGTNSAGDEIWSSRIGGQGDEIPGGIVLADDGYMVAATTKSFTLGGNDIYVANVNEEGEGLDCNVSDVPDDRMFDIIIPDQFIETNSIETRGTNGGFTTTSEQWGGMNTGAISFSGACTCSSEADFESSAPACRGVGIDFIASNVSSGLTYTWDFGDDATPSTFVGENPQDVLFATTGLHLVTLTVGNSSCGTSITKSIEIRETPDVSFTVPSTICEGEVVNFDSPTNTVPGDWRYEWSLGLGAAPINSTAEAPQNVVYATAGEVTVALTIYDQYCSASSSETFTVVPSPTAMFNSTAPKCTGDEVDFVNTGTSNADYNWIFETGNGVTASSAEENPEGIVFTERGLREVLLITSLTTAGTTCSDTVVDAVTINLTPEPGFTSNAPQCVGNAMSFTNTSATNSAPVNWSYNWDFGANASPQISTAMNPSSVTYSTGGSKEVVLRVASEYCSNTVTQNVDVNTLPIPDVVADQTICADRCIEIGGAEQTGTTYSWTASSGTLNDAGSANPEACPEFGTTTYTVTAINANGCSSTDTVVITMIDPTMVNAGSDAEICVGESVQIGSGFVEGQGYIWSPAATLSDPSVPSPTATPDETTTYTVTVQLYGCEAVSDEVTVVVNDLPDVVATTIDRLDSVEIARNESVQLIAGGANEYFWDNGQSLNATGIYNPIATPEQTTVYTVVGTDVNGCSNSDSVTVIVNEPMTWVPNAFTPNDDGSNDYFYVRTGGVMEFDFSIYTRSGQMIFNADNPEWGWDGTRMGTDEQMPQGAYIYHYTATLSDGEEVEETGVVNLIR